jgi:hypothetical protein
MRERLQAVKSYVEGTKPVVKVVLLIRNDEGRWGSSELGANQGSGASLMSSRANGCLCAKATSLLLILL